MTSTGPPCVTMNTVRTEILISSLRLVLLNQCSCAYFLAHRPDNSADRRRTVTQTRTRGVQIWKWSDKNKSCLTTQSWPRAEQRGLNIKPCGFSRLASAAVHRSLTVSLKYCYSPQKPQERGSFSFGVQLNKYSSVSLHTK